jgi:hypothetical protein
MRTTKNILVHALACLALFTFATSSHAGTGAYLWGKGFTADWTDEGTSVGVDVSGNIYITGDFYDTINLGGANLTSYGTNDMYIAKYNSAGVHQWSAHYGGSDIDYGERCAVDAAGNMVVVGRFGRLGNSNFGGSSFSAGELYVAKYNTNGVHQWSLATSVPTSYGIPPIPTGVALDASGNIYVTGRFAGTKTFGATQLVGAGADDIFILKYNSAGTQQFAIRFGSIGSDQPTDLAVDAAGNLLLCGRYSVGFSFGGPTMSNAGLFVVKLTNAGGHIWTYGSGGGNSQAATALATDASSNVVFAGIFNSTINLGGNTLIDNSGTSNIFLAKFNSSGVHQWSESFPTSIASAQANSIAIDTAGNSYLTGVYANVTLENNHWIDFGGGKLYGQGSGDAFVASFDAGGAHRWRVGVGGTDSDFGNDVALDASGNPVITGTFRSVSMTVPGGSIANTGDTDAFLARFGRNAGEPSILAIGDIGNDQGHRVKIKLASSGQDMQTAQLPIVRYDAYRANTPLPTSPQGPATSTGNALDAGWQQVASVPAHSEAVYLMTAPTLADSTITHGQYYSPFFIRAATSNPSIYFDSPVLSGYSLDNLAPSVPSNFIYNGGTLSWHASNAPDFDHFTVYGSNSGTFKEAIVVDYTSGTTMDVSASPYATYYVTASDAAGNEGKPAKTNSLSGVGGTPQSYVLSVANYPNPFNPRTTVRYTVPSRGIVDINVYDTNGALVATLFHGEHNAGAYSADWDGRTTGGSIASSGIYFARITQNGDTRTRKMILLK